MNTSPNKYITVAYELYTEANGTKELAEKAPVEHPFQFISGMGIALDAFEKQITALNKGDKFDFTLSVEEGYGKYEEIHLVELSKEIFKVNGHFDTEHIYPGSDVPLVNSEGTRFNGLVLEVKETSVLVDLNHPLAGKSLNFVGEITESREATQDEIQGMLNRLSGEGCGCGCNSCEGSCGENCDCEGEDKNCGCGSCH